MSELELLFLVLVGIYTWECSCWLRRGSVAVLTWLGRQWRPVHPGATAGNQHGGIILAFPFPPLGQIVSGNQLPLSLATDALLAYVSPNVNPGWRPPQSGQSWQFDQIQTVAADGKKVVVNGKSLLKGPTPSYALYLVRQLSQLKAALKTERPKLIDKLFRDSFDIEAIRQRWQDFQKRTRLIRGLTNILFLYLFAAIPLLLYHLGLKRSWLELLIGLLALTVTTSILFHRVHKKYFPESKDERFTHFLTIMLSPASAIRTQDILSRPLLETFHPLAIVRVFCSREAFLSFAEKMVLEVRFPALPVAPPGDAAAETVERFSRAALQKSIEAFLIRNDVNPDELARPPVPADETCRSYCPRCRSQFTTTEGTCSDCGGLPLMAFVPASKGETEIVRKPPSEPGKSPPRRR